MTLADFSAAVNSVVAARHMYIRAPDRPAKFAVWAESSAVLSYASDKIIAVTLSGVLDYYTDAEYDQTVDRLLAALVSAGVSVRITGIDYMDDISQTVYHMTWELYDGKGKIYS